MDPLLTTDDVAAILRVDAVTVRRMVQRGELDAYRVAGEYRFSTDLLQVYLDQHQLSRRRAEGDVAETMARLTPAAQRVMALAQAEARGFGHDYLGTEHVLLGVLATDVGIAPQTLRAAGVSEEAVREQLPALLGGAGEPAARCRKPSAGGSRRVMPRLKESLARAAGEAQDDVIAPEHLLLGMLADREALAVRLLDRLGVAPEELERRVREPAGEGAQ
jgi:excisionase family DNA binding protein